MRRGWMSVIVIAAMIGALGGCAPTQDVSPPPTPGAATATSSEPTEAPPLVGKTTTVQPLDEALLGGTGRGVHTSNAPAFHGAWFVVPAEPFVKATSEFVTETLDDWAETQTPKEGLPDEGVAISELNIQPELTASGEQVVGVRFVTHEFAGASSSTSYRTFWYDDASHKTGGSRMLLTDDGAEALFETVVEQLRNSPDTFPDVIDELSAEEPLAAFDVGVLDSLNFDTDGSLVAEFDDYAVAAGAAGTVEVRISAEEAAAFLSEFGKRAQAAAKTPASPTFTTPATPPTKPAASPAPVPGPDCTQLRCVAITFDDGPGAHTNELLDILKAAKVPATFFVLGPNAEANPDVLQRMAAEGHQIGNHTWTHRQLTALSADEIRDEYRKTADVIEHITGHGPTTFRPPYGAHNETVRQVLAKEPGGAIILWNVDTLDWKTRDSKATVESVRKDTREGSIILMHDIHAATVKAVPDVVQTLQSAGYTLVTVDQLLADEQPEPGKVFTHRG